MANGLDNCMLEVSYSKVLTSLNSSVVPSLKETPLIACSGI